MTPRILSISIAQTILNKFQIIKHHQNVLISLNALIRLFQHNFTLIDNLKIFVLIFCFYRHRLLLRCFTMPIYSSTMLFHLLTNTIIVIDEPVQLCNTSTFRKE